jgi:Zn-dependent alcohol dehydrogenase
MLLIIVAMILIRIKESVGEGVTHLKPGDKALPVFTGECGECPHCKSEESNMCDLLRINIDRGVMINDNSLDSLLRDSPYTILSVLLHSASILWSMLVVLQKSTLMRHLTKFVYSVVEYAQV